MAGRVVAWSIVVLALLLLLAGALAPVLRGGTAEVAIVPRDGARGGAHRQADESSALGRRGATDEAWQAVRPRAEGAMLHAQPYDAPGSSYAPSRIHAAQLRPTREPVRATSHGSDERQGRAPAPTEQRVAEKDHALMRRAVDSALGWQQPELHVDAPTATSWPSARVAQRFGDRVHPALVSHERPARLELSQAPSKGLGAGQVQGMRGYTPEAHGPPPGPSAAPAQPRAQDVQVSTYQRAYDQYLARMRQKVDPLWEFPRELAVRMEQGEVLVGFTIQKDGGVKDVRVLKGSGFPTFDRNVVGAIKKAAPFEPLPELFGPELRVTAPFEGSNPAIR